MAVRTFPSRSSNTLTSSPSADSTWFCSSFEPWEDESRVEEEREREAIFSGVAPATRLTESRMPIGGWLMEGVEWGWMGGGWEEKERRVSKDDVPSNDRQLAAHPQTPTHPAQHCRVILCTLHPSMYVLSPCPFAIHSAHQIRVQTASSPSRQKR